ncbi:MAG: hypothetical protein ABEJ26_14395 [Halosimplex sp.]
MVRVDRRRDGGQLLLVGAIGLSVLFVVLAVILNAAVTTGTLAARDGTLGEERTVRQLQYEANGSLGGLVGRVNRYNDTTRAALDENLSAGVDDWNRLTGSHLSGRSATAWLSIRGRSYRTDVVHNESSRPFTDRSADRNWTLVRSKVNTTEFRMNVSRASLYRVENGTCQPSTGCFYVEVTDGSDAWRLFVYAPDNASIAVRTVDGSGTNATCPPVDATHAWVNISAGRFAGRTCSAISFGEGVSKPYDVRYRYGDAVTGTYRLTVDSAVDRDPHYRATRSPYLDPTITRVTAEFNYRSTTLNYTSGVRVQSGDRDG